MKQYRIRSSGGARWFVERRNRGDWKKVGVINYPGRHPTLHYHAITEDECFSGCFNSRAEAVVFLMNHDT